MRFRRYFDATVLKYQNKKIPESIRLNIGEISNEQFSVYDAFGRNIPGFQSMSDHDANLLYEQGLISQVSFRFEKRFQSRIYNAIITDFIRFSLAVNTINIC